MVALLKSIFAFAKTPAGMAVLTALAIIFLCLSLIAHGANRERKAEAARDAIAVAAAQALGTTANEVATQAVQREAEQIAVTRKALVDEVVKIADGPPTPADVLYGCRELQRARISTADLPACLAANRGAGAAAHR